MLSFVKLKENFFTRRQQQEKKLSVEDNMKLENNTTEERIPTAKELREKSKSNWKTLTLEDILKKIQSESKDGKTEAYFPRVIISEDIIDVLKQNGYRIVWYDNDSCIVLW